MIELREDQLGALDMGESKTVLEKLLRPILICGSVGLGALAGGVVGAGIAWLAVKLGAPYPGEGGYIAIADWIVGTICLGSIGALAGGILGWRIGSRLWGN